MLARAKIATKIQKHPSQFQIPNTNPSRFQIPKENHISVKSKKHTP
jgi:hypothetical protein